MWSIFTSENSENIFKFVLWLYVDFFISSCLIVTSSKFIITNTISTGGLCFPTTTLLKRLVREKKRVAEQAHTAIDGEIFPVAAVPAACWGSPEWTQM